MKGGFSRQIAAGRFGVHKSHPYMALQSSPWVSGVGNRVATMGGAGGQVPETSNRGRLS